MLRKLSLFLLTSIALMLAACGGGGGGGTTTNNNASSVNLSETYDANGVTFKYPSGWVVQSPEGAAAGSMAPIMLANSQAALDGSSTGAAPQVTSGQQAILVLPLVGETAQAVTAAYKTPADLLKQMGPSMASSESGLALGEPTDTTVGGNSAAQASGSGDKADTKMVAIKIGDGYVLVVGITAKGELGNLEGVVDGLAGSVAVKS
jgi:hypothetical protein